MASSGVNGLARASVAVDGDQPRPARRGAQPRGFRCGHGRPCGQDRRARTAPWVHGGAGACQV